ncbi:MULTISPECIES: TonB system transport protein ExbD [unclassified Campylobacter]|uniref:TonB system transport protein ExbD n=1 Tax=unclassified Campylobacter TaxID=2593542 RepID=UPI001473E417|nr:MULTISPECIES: TonB system transport protein ExbD [unclassified Campylobacter]QKG29901.1 TonB system transport protein ExbD [Campylobacter sp. RM16187]
MNMPKKEGLNVIPLIDIMLVLLAIVLSVSTFIAQGNIPINLPSSESAEQNDENRKVTIIINKDNEFFIDDIKTSQDALKDRLNQIDSRTLVQLKSDKESKFEMFVKVVDILKEKKHENFAITTLTE